MTTGKNDWRERMKEQRRAEQKTRRAAIAADPRVQAIKRALKERQRAARERAKTWRKKIVDERKLRAREQAIDERVTRNTELQAKVGPATRTQ